VWHTLEAASKRLLGWRGNVIFCHLAATIATLATAFPPKMAQIRVPALCSRAAPAASLIVERVIGNPTLNWRRAAAFCIDGLQIAELPRFSGDVPE
jgi:hypothetical protein